MSDGVFFMIPVVKTLMTKSDSSVAAAETYAEEMPEEEGREETSAAAVPAQATGALDFVMPPKMIMYTSSFAAGAILAAAFCLVLPEAQHLLTKTVPEADVFWKYGTCALAGFLLPFLLSYTAAFIAPTATDNTRPNRTMCAVLLGDSFHNFADGAFIAAAFTTCSESFGWTVVVSSIAHEFGQEIADFFVLTGICKLKPLTALALNFLSGMTVILGAIV